MKNKKNEKNTSLFRLVVCGVVDVVLLMFVWEFVAVVWIASFSFNVDVELFVVGVSFNAAPIEWFDFKLRGKRGGALLTPTKLSGTSTAISRCGPKSYSGGPSSPDDELRVLNEPRDFVR